MLSIVSKPLLRDRKREEGIGRQVQKDRKKYSNSSMRICIDFVNSLYHKCILWFVSFTRRKDWMMEYWTFNSKNNYSTSQGGIKALFFFLSSLSSHYLFLEFFLSVIYIWWYASPKRRPQRPKFRVNGNLTLKEKCLFSQFLFSAV